MHKTFRIALICASLALALPPAANAGGSGLLLGGIAGGLLGHSTGSRSHRDAATVIGAVGGAVVGHMLEESMSEPSPRYRNHRTYRECEPAPRMRAYPVVNPGVVYTPYGSHPARYREEPVQREYYERVQYYRESGSTGSDYYELYRPRY